MFKKLALAVSCIYCCAIFATPSPFGISLGKTTTENINKDVVEKPILSSIENISGYSELFLRLDSFTVNDCIPIMAKGFRNDETNTIDAIAMEYRANLTHELTAFLDRKYIRTYTRKTFFGGVSEIEYINKNCLIRVIKTFSGHTVLLYGTIQWFNAYDESHRQLKEIRQMRRDNLELMRQMEFNNQTKLKRKHRHKFGPRHSEQPYFENTDRDPEFFDRPSQKPIKIRPKRHHRERLIDFFDTDFSALENCFANFDSFFNDDFFSEEFSKKPLKNTKNENSQTKTYNFSQSYSKVNDVEQLKQNDNGDVIEVCKTPEKITVTHNGVTKNISPEELQENGGVLNFAIQSDPNDQTEVKLENGGAKITSFPKFEPQAQTQLNENKTLPIESESTKNNQMLEEPAAEQCPRNSQMQFCEQHNPDPQPSSATSSSDKNELMLYGQRLDNVNL